MKLQVFKALVSVIKIYVELCSMAFGKFHESYFAVPFDYSAKGAIVATKMYSCHILFLGTSQKYFNVCYSLEMNKQTSYYKWYFQKLTW